MFSIDFIVAEGTVLMSLVSYFSITRVRFQGNRYTI